MNFKKDRVHKYGSSNIDFRTKRDEGDIKTYQPWLMGREQGTMGLQNFHLTLQQKKATFLTSKKLSTQRDLINEVPPPKLHKTGDYYYKNNMHQHDKTFFEDQRVGFLDETFKGKELFNGDSMMISLNTKLKQKNKKDKSLSIKDKFKRKVAEESLSKIKNKVNTMANMETQLVKIDKKESLDGKVNMEKVQEIKYALRRRYCNRKNLRKIFKIWDVSSNGYISIYDAHKMINQLSIPINYNETRVLFESTSQNDNMTMEDFNSLIHNENQNKVDLANIKCKIFLIYY